MASFASTTNPAQDVAAKGVLQAFRSAHAAGCASVECYRAAVAAWRRAHPDQTPGYAARQAVAVVLSAKGRLHPEA